MIVNLNPPEDSPSVKMNSKAALRMFAGENLLEGRCHPLQEPGLQSELVVSPVLVVAQHQGQLGHTVETVGLKQAALHFRVKILI